MLDLRHRRFLPARRGRGAVGVADVPLLPSIPGLHFWWKADFGVTGTTDVTAWADKVRGDVLNSLAGDGGSGAPVFTASDSGLNGQPSITFGGAANLANGASPALAFPSTVTGCTMAIAFFHTATANNGCWFIYGPTNEQEIRQNSTTNQVNWKGLNSGVALATAAKHIVICTYDNASNVANIYQDGTSVTATSSSNTADTPSVNTLSIGGRRGGALYSDSRVGEALMYPRALSPAEVASLYTYLASVYGAP